MAFSTIFKNLFRFKKQFRLTLICLSLSFVIFLVIWEERMKLNLNSVRNNSNCILTFWYITEMGLGNMMFIYASLYGISRKLHVPAIISTYPTFPLFSYFPNQLFISQNKEIPIYSPFSDLLMDPDDRCCVFSMGNLRNLQEQCNKNGYIRLNYYLQSWKYFDDYRSEIRKQFRCPSHQNRLRSILNGRNISGQYFLVGIHVRRGDFLENPNLVKLGYTHATSGYIIKAMVKMKLELGRIFPNSNKTALFLMLGNDFEWNLKNFENYSDVIVIEPGQSAFDDFCLLTQLEHTIMTVGSFGWWVGYLTGGIVIYDMNYAADGSELHSKFDPEDYFLPDWIGVRSEEMEEV